MRGTPSLPSPCRDRARVARARDLRREDDRSTRSDHEQADARAAEVDPRAPMPVHPAIDRRDPPWSARTSATMNARTAQLVALPRAAASAAARPRATPAPAHPPPPPPSTRAQQEDADCRRRPGRARAGAGNRWRRCPFRCHRLVQSVSRASPDSNAYLYGRSPSAACSSPAWRTGRVGGGVAAHTSTASAGMARPPTRKVISPWPLSGAMNSTPAARSSSDRRDDALVARDEVDAADVLDGDRARREKVAQPVARRPRRGAARRPARRCPRAGCA